MGTSFQFSFYSDNSFALSFWEEATVLMINETNNYPIKMRWKISYRNVFRRSTVKRRSYEGEVYTYPTSAHLSHETPVVDKPPCCMVRCADTRGRFASSGLGAKLYELGAGLLSWDNAGFLHVCSFESIGKDVVIVGANQRKRDSGIWQRGGTSCGSA